ncbi:MAG TPA: hypothetical protein PLQ03_04800 [Brevundimonas sp.]|uniref:hypothetical protein n=1 Tax=Brevundimonas sp. TaxID=1871086 RepID=UPI002610A544|nr:hypothetical protein [Brevundimonas sp.]HRO32714.1 hypothetical protein [Brevundimonas sp.]
MKTPWHLWLVGVASLAWNGLGAWQWWMKTTGSQGYWGALTQAQADYMRAAPLWTDVAFGLTIWCGVLGALLLLLRRRLAFNAYAASLIAILADSTYVHFLSNGREVMGTEGVMFGVVLIVLCAGQTLYARWAGRRGWLR